MRLDNVLVAIRTRLTPVAEVESVPLAETLGEEAQVRAAVTQDFVGADRNAGALTTSVGMVRDDTGQLAAMMLEHYPNITEHKLAAVEAEARRRWPLAGVTIIHRYGRLLPSDNIVFVGVLTSHRGEAFAACKFLVDWPKTKAPFWKYEEGAEGAGWVAAKAEDDARSNRWG